MGSLDGKVAIVTGTSRGVGVGIARELLLAGATVVGCSRSELPGLPGADTVPGGVERSEQWVCDQADHKAIDAFVQRVVDDVWPPRYPREQRWRNRADPARRGGSGACPEDPGHPAQW